MLIERWGRRPTLATFLTGSAVGAMPARLPRTDALDPETMPEHSRGMTSDPVQTNPEHYRVVFENERVRVLEYTDAPGDRTTPHEHPDSVMHTLSSFRRRLRSGDVQRDVDMPAGQTGWLPAQQHSGENIGDTATHVLFIELKDGLPQQPGGPRLGPA